MSMNRVFFIILIFAFLVVPLSINNVNDDGISYFDLVVEISENLFEDTKVEEKKTISLTEDQKQLISEKFQVLINSNNYLFNNFEEIQNENLKEINEYIAINRWQEFSATNSGVKGIYLSGYHFLKEEKISWLILSAIFFGYACSVKYTALIFLIPLFSYLLF